MPSTWTLHRSATDAKVGGVCGGAAERWGVDPVLVRVGLVLLALSGGVGVVLYLAGWLLLPVAGTGRAAVDDLFGGAAARWPRGLWITLLVVACLVSFAVLGGLTPFGVVPAVAVLVLWWLGRRRRDAPAASGSALPPAPTPGRPDAVRDPVPSAPPLPVPAAPLDAAPADAGAAERASYAAFLAQPDPVGLYAEPTPPPVVRPGPTLAARRVRLAGVAGLGLTWLGLGIADASGVPVSLAVYAGAGLLVLALALVVAARWGRARGLLAGAVVLALAALATSSLTPGLVGPAVAAPARQLELTHPLSYTSPTAFPAAGDVLDTGELDVDLTRLDLTTDATYRATVDTGRLVVRTPPGTGVALHYDVEAGHITSYGSPVDAGIDLTGDRVLVAPTTGQPTLTLDLRVGTGVLEVRP